MDNFTENLIWILKDDRPGNYNQSINLVNALIKEDNFLKSEVKVKEISYNFLAKLPNFLKFGLFSTINKESKANLLRQKTKPNIVISAGRRSALVALDLKKIYPDTFFINIMNPGSGIIKKFNLVILPKHDKITSNNAIEIIGSVSFIDKKEIRENAKNFSQIFDKIKSPKIAILLGGSSRNAKFKEKDALEIRQIIDRLCKNMKANLLVTSSRRTDEFLIKEVVKNNKDIKYLFDYSKESLKKNFKNPYQVILQEADFIITTGDSISMCSEVCQLGKPVYIYTNSRICSKKHLNFHKNLFKNKFATKLLSDVDYLIKNNKNKLSEITNVTSQISDKYANFKLNSHDN